MTDLEKQLLHRIDMLVRGIPFHVHRCLDGDHEWECSSPYCAVLQAPCREHGGEVPTHA